MNYKQKEFWTIQAKEGNQILVMPDGQTEFDAEYKAQSALKKYKHRDKYEVIRNSRAVPEKAGDKITSFMKDE